MKAPFLYLLLVLPLLAVRCPREKTDDPKPLAPLEQLPPATMEGKDTFGCLINGQPWSSQQPNLVSHFVTADWTVSDFLAVSISNEVKLNGVKKYRQLSFGFPDTTRLYALREGSYFLTKRPKGNHVVVLDLSEVHYSFTDLLQGQVIFTRLDRQARICSGTFEFTMVGAPGDTVRVTHGRFDISRMAL